MKEPIPNGETLIKGTLQFPIVKNILTLNIYKGFSNCEKQLIFRINKKRPMQLVFATNNNNKLKEVQALLPDHIRILSLKDIGCFEDIPETQPTIAANAKQKANYIKDHYGYDCFADDTGLEIEHLNGAPGVYSARYAGPQRDAHANMDLVLEQLKNKPNRSAQFKTVIALHLNNSLETFTGICEGDITETKHGSDGFGYDPIFKANGYSKTFAEIALVEKNAIGHRGKAVRLLVDYLNRLQTQDTQ